MTIQKKGEIKYEDNIHCRKCGVNCFNAGLWGKERYCEECFDKIDTLEELKTNPN